jgi:hypothetical protein
MIVGKKHTKNSKNEGGERRSLYLKQGSFHTLLPSLIDCRQKKPKKKKNQTKLPFGDGRDLMLNAGVEALL